MPSRRSVLLIAVTTVLCVGSVVLTLRAAGQAMGTTGAGAAHAEPTRRTVLAAEPAQPSESPTRQEQANRSPQSHPPPSAPEESATIADDPTTAPDASQSADHNVSFPNDI